MGIQRGKIRLTKQILLLEKEGFVFLLNSKCASSSIRRMAIHQLGYGDNLTYLKEKDLLQMTDKRIILVARNPYKRMVSLWLDKTQRTLYRGFRPLGITKGIPFVDFVRRISEIPNWASVDSHLWPQTILLTKHTPEVKILKVEQLKEDWPKALPKLQVQNKGKFNVNYLEYITPEVKRIITKIYFKDLEVLGYE